MRWDIYYYYNRLPLTVVPSEKSTLEECPKTNVVFFDVFYKEYRMRMVGYDWYYLDKTNNYWEFGGWHNNAGFGSYYRWDLISGECIQYRSFVFPVDKILFEGIFVPRPDSVVLGLEDADDPPTVNI